MKYIKIKDFTTVITGGTPSTTKAEYWEGGNIPWLNSGELNQKTVIKSNNYITEIGLKNSPAKLMPSGTVLIALTGSTTGVVGYLTFKACANQSVTGILPSPNHDSRYLYHYLNLIRPKVLSDAYGGAQPHISQGYVKDLEIPLPDLAAQQKIAALIDKADELRQYNKQLIEKYDALTQSLFLDMFGDPVRNEKGWNIVNFGTHITTLTDYHANGSYESLREVVALKDDVDFALMVRTTDLEKNNFEEDVKYISEEAYNYLTKSQVFGNEIIINKIGSAGNVYLMPDLKRPVSLGMNAFLLRFDDNIEVNFVYFLLKSEYGEREIKKRVKGAVTKTIRKDAIREIPIIVPPVTLQHEFVERLSAIKQQKELAQQALQKSDELFKSLLQKAFKGELVPEYEL